jgi:small subunit ribosomal protein S2
MAVTVSLEKLLEVGAHFGHQYKRWNPKMKPFMYAVKDGIFVFDLIKTNDQLIEALEVLTEASKNGKTILIVGTKKQAKQKVVEVGEATGCPYVSERWLGGTLTNFMQIKRSVDRLSDLDSKIASKEYTKKEKLLMERKVEKIKKACGGIFKLDRIPDLMIIVDVHREKGAIAEARNLRIPTIGIIDSNADPNKVNWPVPMNDDATKAIEYVLDLMKEAILEGKNGPVKTPKVKAKAKKATKTNDK